MKLQASRGIKVKEGFIYIIALTICLGTAKNATAATHIVLPFSSIQAKINAATAGDTIIIKGGTYAGEAITINKLLDIRPAQGESVTINEGVTLQNLVGTQNLANFIIGGTSTKNLTINNCTKVYLDNLDMSTSGGGLIINTHSFVQSNNCTFGTTLTMDTNSTLYAHNSQWNGDGTVTNSKITARKCIFKNDLTCNKSSVTLLKTTVDDNFHCPHAVDDYGRATTCVVFQSTVGRASRSHCNMGAARTWLSYSNLRRVECNGEIYIIGNDFFGGQHMGHDQWAIKLMSANTTAQILNNRIWNYGNYDNYDTGSSRLYRSGVGIWVSGAINNFVIRNNVFWNLKAMGYRNLTDCAHGIYADTAPTTMSYIENNHFEYIDFRASYGGDRVGNSAVYAKASMVTMRYNNFRNLGGSQYTGGVVPNYNTTNDPVFTNAASGVFTLQAGSQINNLGAPEADYNDHDGTRNDIGAYGGHRYDPNGATTTKPVTLSTGLSKIYLLRGTDTTITIKSRGAVVTP